MKFNFASHLAIARTPFVKGWGVSKIRELRGHFFRSGHLIFQEGLDSHIKEMDSLGFENAIFLIFACGRPLFLFLHILLVNFQKNFAYKTSG